MSPSVDAARAALAGAGFSDEEISEILGQETTPEPAYRSAFSETQSPICPECGHDFSSEKRAGVLAHIEGHHPAFNVLPLTGEARVRKAQLIAIARRQGD